MRIQRGSPMTQLSNRRLTSRAASALVFVSTLMIALPGTAGAQTFGYASTQPESFPTDEVMPPADEGVFGKALAAIEIDIEVFAKAALVESQAYRPADSVDRLR